jgi:leader peptidase (prepilin peptidase)/N-methyltransferase
MIRILGTTFAALLGLAFGSFLNVCLSRWPQGESIVHPRSHCRNCDHTLAWWENIPLLSWLALRGRCRKCRTWISWRYPLVELAIAALWAYITWAFARFWSGPQVDFVVENLWTLIGIVGAFVFSWLLVALAVLDAENLWLPDWLTIPGVVLGYLSTVSRTRLFYETPTTDAGPPLGPTALRSLLEIAAAAALILIIRWLYRLIRHREGLGLGDAKLMALLAAWLGFPGALLAFALAIFLGAGVALVLLAIPSASGQPKEWAARKLPLGTFLCIGGIVSSLWGQPIIAAYLRLSGL